MPTLRIAYSGIDFCDTCTTLKQIMATCDRNDPRYQSSEMFIERHRAQAKSEFDFYKSCQKGAESSGANRTYHLVFDFAETFLLPRLEKKTRTAPFHYRI